MKTLRHLGGILLGAIGLMFSLGSLANAGDPQAGMSGIALLMFGALGCLQLLGAALLLWPSVTSIGSRRCPECSSEERAPAGLLVNNRSWWAYQFGGWLLASLWGASRETQVRCVKCDTLYFTQSVGTRIAGALLWMIVLCFLLAEIINMLMGG